MRAHARDASRKIRGASTAQRHAATAQIILGTINPCQRTLNNSRCSAKHVSVDTFISIPRSSELQALCEREEYLCSFASGEVPTFRPP
jgi:hypothetical protein